MRVFSVISYRISILSKLTHWKKRLLCGCHITYELVIIQCISRKVRIRLCCALLCSTYIITTHIIRVIGLPIFDRLASLASVPL